MNHGLVGILVKHIGIPAPQEIIQIALLDILVKYRAAGMGLNVLCQFLCQTVRTSFFFRKVVSCTEYLKLLIHLLRRTRKPN